MRKTCIVAALILLIAFTTGLAASDKGQAASFSQDQPAPQESERIAQQIHRQLIEAEKSYRDQPGRAANFLVRADLIPILEQRAAQYAATPD